MGVGGGGDRGPTCAQKQRGESHAPEGPRVLPWTHVHSGGVREGGGGGGGCRRKSVSHSQQEKNTRARTHTRRRLWSAIYPLRAGSHLKENCCSPCDVTATGSTCSDRHRRGFWSCPDSEGLTQQLLWNNLLTSCLASCESGTNHTCTAGLGVFMVFGSIHTYCTVPVTNSLISQRGKEIKQNKGDESGVKRR